MHSRTTKSSTALRSVSASRKQHSSAPPSTRQDGWLVGAWSLIDAHFDRLTWRMQRVALLIAGRRRYGTAASHLFKTCGSGSSAIDCAGGSLRTSSNTDRGNGANHSRPLFFRNSTAQKSFDIDFA